MYFFDLVKSLMFYCVQTTNLTFVSKNMRHAFIIYIALGNFKEYVTLNTTFSALN